MSSSVARSPPALTAALLSFSSVSSRAIAARSSSRDERARRRAVGRRQRQHRDERGDADVHQLLLRDFVEPIAVGVVVHVGEMPEERTGLLELEERRVVAAALERIRAHDPTRGRRLVEAPREKIVVVVVRHEVGLRERTAAPLGVVIVAARPDRRRIGHLLDEERAARLLRVLAGHVEAQAPVHAARAHGIVGEEIPRLRDLEAEEHRDRALRLRSALCASSPSTRAISLKSPTPEALSLAPGSCTCALRTYRSVGAALPCTSATIVSSSDG